MNYAHAHRVCNGYISTVLHIKTRVLHLYAKMWTPSFTWILFSELLLCFQTAESNDLSVLLMVSNSARFNTSGAAVAFDLALKQINSEPSLLNGYKLNLSMIIDDKVFSIQT